MDEEEISYRVLRKIQELEKKSPVLTSIKNSFYSSVSEYLKNLNKRFEKEEDPQKKTLLKDEIQNTRKIVANIYEQREKKILLAAISRARGGNPDVKNMLSDEESLFESVLTSMERSRDAIFENKKCNIEEKTQEKTEEKETKDEINDELKPQNHNDITTKIVTAGTNPILLVTQDIPEFVGTDTKKYNLRKEDIISTPEDMANMLCKRNAVERLEL